jgi:hypothetical protein
MTRIDPAEVARLRELEAKATPGPWRSMRDGNQYTNTRFLPTAKLVGASRLDGVTRPWNPNKYVTFGFKPEEFETARFLDADADLIAAMRSVLLPLLDENARLRALLGECAEAFKTKWRRVDLEERLAKELGG